MTTHEHHQELLGELAENLKEVFEGSNQAVYIYLDDTHKVCNQQFADLLGYTSPDEWAAVTDPFPQVFVAEASQSALVGAFQQAIEQKVASSMPVTWLKKDKSTIDTTVILVPISFGHHLFALHFVSKS
jgi:PAS domain-containing protein